MRTGILPDKMMTVLLVECANGYKGVKNLQSFINCKQPLAYVHIVILLVKVNNILMCVQQGNTLAELWHDKTLGSSIKYLWTALSILFICIVTFIFNSMIMIAEIISNPLDEDRLSFPGIMYEKHVGMEAEIFGRMILNKPWDYKKFREKGDVIRKMWNTASSYKAAPGTTGSQPSTSRPPSRPPGLVAQGRQPSAGSLPPLAPPPNMPTLKIDTSTDRKPGPGKKSAAIKKVTPRLEPVAEGAEEDVSETEEKKEDWPHFGSQTSTLEEEV